MEKGKLIYYAIIVVGIGAIAYMYKLSDAGNKKTFSEDIDEAIKENNLTITR